MSYICDGSVRGQCPHIHRTIKGALKCLHRDQEGCRSQGGYSDREILHSDGSPLTDIELYISIEEETCHW